jgi:hypothetical protein
MLHDMPQSFVNVDIAGFEVGYFRDGKLVWPLPRAGGHAVSQHADLPFSHHLSCFEPDLDRSTGHQGHGRHDPAVLKALDSEFTFRKQPVTKDLGY